MEGTTPMDAITSAKSEPPYRLSAGEYAIGETPGEKALAARKAETVKQVETVTHLIVEYSERLRKSTDDLYALQLDSMFNNFLLLLSLSGAMASASLNIFESIPQSKSLPLTFKVGISLLIIGLTFYFAVRAGATSGRTRRLRRECERLVRHLSKLLTRALELNESNSVMNFEQRIELDFRIADTESLIAYADDTIRHEWSLMGPFKRAIINSR